MKRSARILICLGAMTVGALAGWLLRSSRAASAAVISGPDKTGAAAASTAARRSQAQSAAEEFAAQFHLTKGAERWLLLITAAEKARAADMPRLLDLADGNEAIVRMLSTRWAELSPRHMFDSLLARMVQDRRGDSTLFEVLLTEWMKRDPSALIAALSETSGRPGINHLWLEQQRGYVVSQLMKTDPVAALAQMAAWGINRHRPDLRTLEKWIADNPGRASTLATSIDASVANEEVLRIIGKAWAKTDPAAALAFASNLPAAQRYAFSGSAISDWAKQDLKAATAFIAAQNDPGYRGHLAGPLIEAWAANDPSAAFAWSQENLKGAARAQSINSVVKAVAARSMDEATALVNGLETGQTKQLAVNALLETLVKNFDPFRPDPAARDAALAWLSTLPDKEAAKQALEKSTWKLFNNDPDAARAFLSGPHADIAPAALWFKAASEMAKANPASAMEWLPGVPAEHQQQATSTVLNTWMSMQPDAATAWVVNLPAGERRTTAFKEIARSIAWFPDAWAARMLEALPAADRPLAREAIHSATLPPERRARLLEALR